MYLWIFYKFIKKKYVNVYNLGQLKVLVIKVYYRKVYKLIENCMSLVL